MAASFDLSAIGRISGVLRETQQGAQRAVQRAKSTLRDRLPVEARRDIQGEYTLSASRIRAGLQARTTVDGVDLIGSGRGIGLVNFQGRWGGRKTPGAVAQTFSGEAPYSYDGTFIATGLNANAQIFDRIRGHRRKMTAGNYVGKRRDPLKVLYGPSVASMLRKPGRADRLSEFARTVLGAEIARQVKL